MALFEFEKDGKRYEVDAPSEAAAIAAFNQAHQPQRPEPSIGAVPEISPMDQMKGFALGGDQFMSGVKQGAWWLADQAGLLPPELSSPEDPSVMDPSPLQQWTDEKAQEFARRRAALPQTAQNAALAASMAPYFVIPGPKVRGFTPRVATSTAESGALGLTTFTPDAASKGRDAATAGLFGMAAELPLAFGGKLGSSFSDRLRKAESVDPQMTASLKKGEQAVQDATRSKFMQRYELTPGQLTRDPWLLRMESIAAGPNKLRWYRAQADAIQGYFYRSMEKIRGVDWRKIAQGKVTRASYNKWVEKARASYQKHIGELRKARRSMWQSGMNQARAEAQGARVINAQNLREEYKSIIKEYSKSDDPTSLSIVASAKDQLARLGRRGQAKPQPQGVILDAKGNPPPAPPPPAFGGKLTVDELQAKMADFREIASGGKRVVSQLDASSNVNMAIGARLKSALGRDIDDAVAQGAAAGAIRTLKATRKEYGRQSAAIEDLRKTTLERVFGKGAKTDEDVLTALAEMSPSNARKAVEIYANSPGVLKGLRENYLRKSYDAAVKSGKKRSLTQGGFDMETMLRQFDTDGVFKALYKPSEQSAIKKGLMQIRAVMSKLPEEGMHQASFFSDLMGVLVSLHPVFVARLYGRMRSAEWLDKVLFTAGGREALKTLGQRGVPAQTFDRAVAMLGLNIEVPDGS